MFITVACNSYRPEIDEALLDGQKPDVRPDLRDRVFKMKGSMLASVLKSGKIFNYILVHVCVVELLTTSIHRAHINKFYNEYSKIRLHGPEYVDTLLSAKLLTNEDENLRSHVVKHIIHKLCMEIRNALCLKFEFLSQFS